MSKAIYLTRRPRHRAAQQSPAIAFNLVFILCCSFPVLLVVAASLQLTNVVLVLTSLVALYDTLYNWAMLALASQPDGRSRQRLRQTIQPQADASLHSTATSSLRSSTATPSLAIIIPAWNEQAALPRTLESVLAQTLQPNLIIVADDGSTDDTIARLTELYALEFHSGLGYSRTYPQLRVLAKPHSGKADSINQAIAYASVDLVLTLDADTRLLPGSCAALIKAFQQDPSLSVVGGVLLPRCSKTLKGRLFEFVQRYEYARMHLLRLVWSRFNSSLIVSGACAAFRRDVLVAIGGFNRNSWVEDYEIMFRLHQYWRSRRQPCRVRVEPGLRVHTDAPDNLEVFLRQRRRWAGGFLETMFQYRHLVGNARYGSLGLVYLINNTAVMPAQPLFLLAGLVTSIMLYAQQVTVPAIVLYLILAKILLDSLSRLASVQLYRQHFQRSREVSLLGGCFDAIIGSLTTLLLAQISHTWGWWSCWQRQAKW